MDKSNYELEVKPANVFGCLIRTRKFDVLIASNLFEVAFDEKSNYDTK